MLKKIVDFKKLLPDLSTKLKDKYPDGFESEDIIKFKNSAGEEVKAIRMEDPDNDIIYLIKIERKLAVINDEFMEDDFADESDDIEVDDTDVDFDDDDEDDNN